MLYFKIIFLRERLIVTILRFPLILCLCLGTALYAQDREYELGRGFQIGNLPLYLGGYFSVNYEHAYSKVRTLELDELAIMAYGDYNQFSYMLELEAEDVYNEVIGDDASEEVKEEFHIERLYLNYDFNENYALKLGKYNSPIGLWNSIPINVLRDTSSSPVITSLLFPKFTSGAELLYNSQNEHAISINTMIQVGEDLDKLINNDIYNNFNVNQHYGVGLSLQDEQINYQLNTGYFEETTGESYTYVLGAFEYEHDDFKLQAEVGTQFDEDGSSIPYIGYLQYSQIIKDDHQVILRLETYKDEMTDTKDSFAVIGYTYRPLYPIALKSEYQWHSQDVENKLLLSFSVLF